MLTTIEKKSLLNALVTSSCGAIITLAAMTGSVSAASIHTSSASPATGSCLYSAQLASDPALKAAFTNRINAIKGGIIEDDSEELIYDTNIPAGETSSRSFNDPSGSTDRLSNDCLSCHDGVMAQNFKLRVKNNPGGRVMSLEDITGAHPVGMEYNRYASVDSKGYKSDVSFSNEMVFAEGKVGCLTCHNPLNKDKGHLVMNNSRSELCFACHNK